MTFEGTRDLHKLKKEISFLLVVQFSYLYRNRQAPLAMITAGRFAQNPLIEHKQVDNQNWELIGMEVFQTGREIISLPLRCAKCRHLKMHDG